FGVWMLFFDNNNFIAQFRLSATLNELEMEKDYYLSEIEKDRQACYELRTDTLTLEKFGREQYLMKRDNEDIYLIVDEGK
ncbi:MAG: septum formation initiator family protein, partial [Bacteroidetes bacterium]|nr:septum formation initiator family protein [Bacteroidota bacterium]